MHLHLSLAVKVLLTLIFWALTIVFCFSASELGGGEGPPALMSGARHLVGCQGVPELAIPTATPVHTVPRIFALCKYILSNFCHINKLQKKS